MSCPRPRTAGGGRGGGSGIPRGGGSGIPRPGSGIPRPGTACPRPGSALPRPASALPRGGGGARPSGLQRPSGPCPRQAPVQQVRNLLARPAEHAGDAPCPRPSEVPSCPGTPPRRSGIPGPPTPSRLRTPGSFGFRRPGEMPTPRSPARSTQCEEPQRAQVVLLPGDVDPRETTVITVEMPTPRAPSPPRSPPRAPSPPRSPPRAPSPPRSPPRAPSPPRSPPRAPSPPPCSPPRAPSPPCSPPRAPSPYHNVPVGELIDLTEAPEEPCVISDPITLLEAPNPVLPDLPLLPHPILVDREVIAKTPPHNREVASVWKELEEEFLNDSQCSELSSVWDEADWDYYYSQFDPCPQFELSPKPLPTMEELKTSMLDRIERFAQMKVKEGREQGGIPGYMAARAEWRHMLRPSREDERREYPEKWANMSNAEIIQDIRRVGGYSKARREEARQVHQDALNFYQKMAESGPPGEFRAAQERMKRWGALPHQYPAHVPFTQMPPLPRRIESPPPGPSCRPDPAPCPSSPQDPTVRRYLEMRSRIHGQQQEDTCPSPPAPNIARIPQIAAAYDRYFNPETNYQQENICDITPPEWGPEFDDSF